MAIYGTAESAHEDAGRALLYVLCVLYVLYLLQYTRCPLESTLFYDSCLGQGPSAGVVNNQGSSTCKVGSTNVGWVDHGAGLPSCTVTVERGRRLRLLGVKKAAPAAPRKGGGSYIAQSTREWNYPWKRNHACTVPRYRSTKYKHMGEITRTCTLESPAPSEGGKTYPR